MIAFEKANAAKTPKATLHPNASERSAPIGIPNIVAQTIPNVSIDNAFPAFFDPVKFTELSLANAQYTGNAIAGMTRANAITPKFGAIAASVFAKPNIVSIKTNNIFRSYLEKNEVRNGPNAATVNANKVTSNPIVEILTFKSRAIEGRRPTIKNSVVRIVNPAADNK